jgi:hypothetical protein
MTLECNFESTNDGHSFQTMSAQLAFALLTEVADDAHTRDAIRVHEINIFAQRESTLCFYFCGDVVFD